MPVAHGLPETMGWHPWSCKTGGSCSHLCAGIHAMRLRAAYVEPLSGPSGALNPNLAHCLAPSAWFQLDWR